MIYGRCAACKYLRRRCPLDCIFSPYFPSNDPERFSCVHKIYGASNVGKMLQVILISLACLSSSQTNIYIYIYPKVYKHKSSIYRNYISKSRIEFPHIRIHECYLSWLLTKLNLLVHQATAGSSSSSSSRLLMLWSTMQNSRSCVWLCWNNLSSWSTNTNCRKSASWNQSRNCCPCYAQQLS